MGMRIKISPLDKLFSEYVRRRDKGICQRCGANRGWKNLQCVHYHSRRKRSVRFDDANAIAACLGCHQFFHENPDEFKAFMRQRLGAGLDLLDSRARIMFPRPDEAAIKLYLQQEIKKLGKEG